MKCPNCSKDYGLFSKEMTELGKTKTCPACGASVTMGIRRGRFFLGFGIVAAITMLLGLSSPIAAGIAGGVGALVGIGLKRA